MSTDRLTAKLISIFKGFSVLLSAVVVGVVIAATTHCGGRAVKVSIYPARRERGLSDRIVLGVGVPLLAEGLWRCVYTCTANWTSQWFDMV